MKSVFFHSFDDLRQNRINKSATRRQEAPVKLRSVEFEMGAPLLSSLYFCHFYIHNFHSYCYIFIFDLMHHLRKSCTDPLYSCDDSQTCCPVDFVSMLLQIALNSFWLKAWNQHLLKWWNNWRWLSIINYAHDLFSWTRVDLDVAHLEEMQSAVPTRRIAAPTVMCATPLVELVRPGRGDSGPTICSFKDCDEQECAETNNYT